MLLVLQRYNSKYIFFRADKGFFETIIFVFLFSITLLKNI